MITSPRNHSYRPAVEAELAMWPGVTASHEIGGKHYAIVLAFGATSRFVVYPATPGDSIRGAYYDFVGDTVQAFRDAGLDYYNEAILVTAVGSLPIRAGKQFASGRKLGKTHQNVLVFLKGNAKRAVAALGEVEFGELGEAELGSEGV